MKTVTGIVNSAEPISLSKAAKLLSGFVSSENESSQDVSAYLRRASAAFTELRSIHREIRSTIPKSELGGAKGIDDLVENETVTGEESVQGRKQDEIKEVKKKKKKRKEKKKEDVVEENENVQLEEERKVKKKKSKKNKKEDVIDEQRSEERKERNSDVKIGSEERKSKKKRKSKEIEG